MNRQQLQLVEDLLQDELAKRGYHAPIILETSADYLSLTSDSFQTNPVMFKDLRLKQGFTSIVYVTSGDFNYYEIIVEVKVCYDLFSGGSNSTELFTLSCRVAENTLGLITIR